MAKESFAIFIDTVKADLFRCRRARGLRGFLRSYVRRPGFRYIFWMRLAAYLRGSPLLKVLYWVVSLQRYRLEVKYGISIPPTTRIGPGFFISHCGGIVVNELVSLGRNCNLSHGVTIGQKNRGKHKGCPSIGDSVFIGAGACIIGGITIGSHAAIGAHAVVVRDVGENEVVAGNPAQTVSMEGSRDYVNWILDEEHLELARSEYELEGIS
jgi:serine O-acetyltransferase